MVHAGTLTVGKLTSFMTYSFQILMSLMMLSMVLMMLSRSVASVQRIIEVLEEEPDIKDPVNPITEVKNGEIDFMMLQKVKFMLGELMLKIIILKL